MGYRLHFAKQFKVDWDGGYFSGSELDTVAEMFRKELESFWTDEHSDIWEINKEELEGYISKLKSYPPAAANSYFKTDEVGEKRDVATYGYTNQDMIEILEHMLKNSEPNEDYIRIEWF